MTKEQLIQIAKAAFPSDILEDINFSFCEMYCMSNVYRLYDAREGFKLNIPVRTLFSIHIFDDEHDKFVQIHCIWRFNTYAAIKEMQRLEIIS